MPYSSCNFSEWKKIWVKISSIKKKRVKTKTIAVGIHKANIYIFQLDHRPTIRVYRLIKSHLDWSSRKEMEHNAICYPKRENRTQKISFELSNLFVMSSFFFQQIALHANPISRERKKLLCKHIKYRPFALNVRHKIPSGHKHLHTQHTHLHQYISRYWRVIEKQAIEKLCAGIERKKHSDRNEEIHTLGVSVFVFVHRADLVWLRYLLFFLTVFSSPFHHRFELSTLTHTQTLAHSLTYHTTYGSDHKSSSDVHAHRLLFDIFSFHCLFCFYYSFSLFV